jgi:hypothetical protein
VIVQVGDGHLILHSEDVGLVNGFKRLYRDCEVDSESARGLGVECRVVAHRDRGEVALHAQGPEPIDLPAFFEAAFTERGGRRIPGAPAGWQGLESTAPPVTFRGRGPEVVFPAAAPWRGVAANLGIGLVIRFQPDTIFLHGAAVALGGSRGVVFVGPKSAGKTTTALGLATRGHTFLGDELVGVRQSTLDLVPVLRTISKRDGPCASDVDDAVNRVASARTVYPDGHRRTNVRASALFEGAGRPVRLQAIVFLDAFGDEASLTPVEPSFAAASALTPLGTTLWGRPPQARLFALLRLLGATRAYRLRLGTPDRTASLLEQAFVN